MPQCLQFFRRSALLSCVLFFFGVSFASAQVQPITSWSIGLTGPDRNTAGEDRLLIFTVGMENYGDRTVTSVTYGGQTLTQVATATIGSYTFTRAYVFCLDEAGIAAATDNNFVVNWSSVPSEEHYAARMYEQVDQDQPIRDSDVQIGSSTPNPITTPALDVLEDDLVVAVAQSGIGSTYTWNNGFAKGVDFHSGSTSQHSTADKSITATGTEIASATNAPTPNRQVILGVVLAAANKGPVGSWEFEEGFGTQATDSSGNNHHASLTGASGWGSGRCGQTVTLDGSTSWVDAGQINIGTEGYTAVVWFKTPTRRQQTIFAATATGTDNHATILQLDTAGRLQFVHRYPAATSGGTTLVSTEKFSRDAWHCAIATKSETELRLYVDGELVSQENDTSGIESAVDVALGRLGATLSQQYFKGSLDDVQLHPRALTANEVGELYGMVLRWRFDEETGTAAADSSVYGHSGTLAGGLSFATDSVDQGKVEQALEFDGVGQFVSVANSSTLQTTGDLTISVWAKPAVTGQYMGIAGKMKNSGGLAGYTLVKHSDNTFRFLVGKTSSHTLVPSDRAYHDTNWHHLVGVRKNDVNYLYIDGVQQSYTPTFTMTDSGQMAFAGRQYSSGSLGRFFDGQIDDLRIFHRALCADEIESIYNGTTPRGVRIIKWIEVK